MWHATTRATAWNWRAMHKAWGWMLLRRYHSLSAAASDTDFVIYNIPQLVSVALTMPLFYEMLKNPRVAAVKNSSVPVQDIQMFKVAEGKSFTVFNGPNEQFVGGRVMGVNGEIGGTYAVMPELFLKADELLRAGMNADAQAIQYDINEIIAEMCKCKGNLYAVMKEILRRREDLDLGGVRAPLPNLVPQDIPQVERCAMLIDSAVAKEAALGKVNVG